ncbi:MAG: glycoside hydrolase family 3 C-terminal domain-containing protein [Anaerolineales bacterium]|nr:glycoside hydrolase family 3 C-terminal domain-containing protein [Anaerolineales bacterium]
MDFATAVKNYRDKKTKENLRRQVDALLAEMTLREKIYLLSGRGVIMSFKNRLLHSRFYNYEPIPAGGCKRLGIPPVLFTDGPRGVVLGNSTCLPAAMCRASAFDDGLEYRAGKLIAAEAIAQGANFFAGICINLVRNPRGGRSQESYGEDPFLLGKMGAALTRSVQEEGMIACPKHFALNSIEDLRFHINVTADDRTLHEVYLPHFRKCVEAGALSIMGAYNRFDEFYCCENRKLLTDILRREWGFDGFVMSDFVWGVHDAEHSLRAGCDIEMMFTIHYRKIGAMLRDGRLNVTHVDRAAGNILSVLIRSVPNIQPREKSVVASASHRALARETAEKGIVLLQNNGLLPLPADTPLTVAGNYADRENVGDNGSSRVYSAGVVTPYAGLKDAFARVNLSQGINLQEALAASEESRTVVVCAGSDSSQEGEYVSNTRYGLKRKQAGAGGDRASLRLSAGETALIRGLKAAGRKVVVVLFAGCAVIVEEWKASADAILMNYYSGVEGGTALANILSGKVNPSGKLPFTVAKDEADYPPFLEIGQQPYEIEYGYYHGYTLFDKKGIEPAFPFGFGLNYTTFQIGKPAAVKEKAAVLLSVEVKNTGSRDGTEVVQVYAGSDGAGQDRPVKLLKAFQRVEVKAGRSKRISLRIDKEDLKFYNPLTGQWALDKSYTLYVGNSSPDAMRRRTRVVF